MNQAPASRGLLVRVGPSSGDREQCKSKHRTLLFFIVRVVKRPRGAPGPRKQLSVRLELSVREVPPGDGRRGDPPAAPRCARKGFDFLMKLKAKSKKIAPRCARKGFNFLRKLKAKSRFVLSSDWLSVREVPPDPENN